MQEVHLNLSHNNFFCPVTGEQICGDEVANPDVTSVRFIYLPEVGDFETIDPDLEVIADQIREDLAAKEEADEDFCEEFFDVFKEALKKDEANESLVIYSISTSGIACGPVGQTVHIAIDMDYEVEDEIDEDAEEED